MTTTGTKQKQNNWRNDIQRGKTCTMKSNKPCTGFTDEQAGYWLAGFIDGEGCVYFRRNANGSRRVITVSNTNKVLIDLAAKLYTQLGIDYCSSDKPGSTANRLHVYTLNIMRAASCWRFRELVPIQHPDKIQKLNDMLSFVRGVHCKLCGVMHDEETKGCIDCRKRHAMRRRAKERYNAALLPGN